MFWSENVETYSFCPIGRQISILAKFDWRTNFKSIKKSPDIFPVCLDISKIGRTAAFWNFENKNYFLYQNVETFSFCPIGRWLCLLAKFANRTNLKGIKNHPIFSQFALIYLKLTSYNLWNFEEKKNRIFLPKILFTDYKFTDLQIFTKIWKHLVFVQ